jgi:Leucine Rich repeat
MDDLLAQIIQGVRYGWISESELDEVCNVLHWTHEDTFSILSLSHCKIGNSGVKKLACALVGNTALKRLQLNDCKVTDVSPLTDILRRGCCALSELHLCRNVLSNEQAHHLSRMLCENATLKTLSFTWSDPDVEGLLAIVRSLSHNGTLERMRIDDAAFNMSPYTYGRSICELKNNATLLKFEVRSRVAPSRWPITTSEGVPVGWMSTLSRREKTLRKRLQHELSRNGSAKKRELRKWLSLKKLIKSSFTYVSSSVFSTLDAKKSSYVALSSFTSSTVKKVVQSSSLIFPSRYRFRRRSCHLTNSCQTHAKKFQ